MKSARWVGGVLFLGLLLGGVWPGWGASSTAARIVVLHHSTGGVIFWDGGLPDWFGAYNGTHGTAHQIEELNFPEEGGNYPFDYWELWVRHGDAGTFRGSPTLATLTAQYDVVVWKHCYPVSEIEADSGHPDVASPAQTLENYKLQYLALREVMRTFPATLFVVWTGAVHTRANLAPEAAQRMRSFVDWIRGTWDEPGDNVVLWDFYRWETDGELYLKDAYAVSPTDSHPNGDFARRVAPDLGQTIVDALAGNPPLPTAVPTVTGGPSPLPTPESSAPAPSGGGGGCAISGFPAELWILGVGPLLVLGWRERRGRSGHFGRGREGER